MKGRQIVVIIPSFAERYLSTPLVEEMSPLVSFPEPAAE